MDFSSLAAKIVILIVTAIVIVFKEVFTKSGRKELKNDGAMGIISKVFLPIFLLCLLFVSDYCTDQQMKRDKANRDKIEAEFKKKVIDSVETLLSLGNENLRLANYNLIRSKQVLSGVNQTKLLMERDLSILPDTFFISFAIQVFKDSIFDDSVIYYVQKRFDGKLVQEPNDNNKIAETFMTISQIMQSFMYSRVNFKFDEGQASYTFSGNADAFRIYDEMGGGQDNLGRFYSMLRIDYKKTERKLMVEFKDGYLMQVVRSDMMSKVGLSDLKNSELVFENCSLRYNKFPADIACRKFEIWFDNRHYLHFPVLENTPYQKVLSSAKGNFKDCKNFHIKVDLKKHQKLADAPLFGP